MEKIKVILKRTIITYLIFYIVLSSVSTCFARGYDEACGEFVSQYARDFIATYCTPETKTEYRAIGEPNWTGGAFGQGIFQCCCTAGVKYMYELALGINIYDCGFNPSSTTAYNQMIASSNWIEINSESDLKAGDILIRRSGKLSGSYSSGHSELYIGSGERANFGNDPYSGVVRTSEILFGVHFEKAFRLVNTVDVNPSGTVRGSSTSNISYSKFFFNGIPDGQYSIPSRTIWETIIDTLAQVLDFLLNLILYIIRMVFVGWTAVMENLLNWGINVVSDTNAESKDLDISSTEASTVSSSKYEQKVTIDSIIFNKLELFDINVFSFE